MSLNVKGSVVFLNSQSVVVCPGHQEKPSWCVHDCTVDSVCVTAYLFHRSTVTYALFMLRENLRALSKFLFISFDLTLPLFLCVSFMLSVIGKHTANTHSLTRQTQEYFDECKHTVKFLFCLLMFLFHYFLFEFFMSFYWIVYDKEWHFREMGGGEKQLKLRD